MHKLNITVKIWLSVGVFILGYMISTSLSQLQSYRSRASLDTASASLFPATQQSQQAESAFQRETTEFSNAAIMQDASGIEHAAADGHVAVTAIKAIAAIPDLSAERSKEAAALATSLDQLLSDSRSIYQAAMSGSMTPDTQSQMSALASRTNDAKAALAKIKDESAGDLHQQLSTLEDQSNSQGTTNLVLFLITMVVAGVIVHLTIRQSITGPVILAVTELSDGAAQISSAASQVATSSQSLAQGSSEQAASLEETSSATEEINSMARRNTESTHTMSKLVSDSQSEFVETNRHLDEMVVAMNEINDSSSKISKIIKVIDEIAFQTNILALNAAVEAARAGEAGMGFAVVADEVRNLAQRCAQAARDTADLIEDSVAKSGGGKAKLGMVASSIQRITAQSLEIKTLVDEVSHGSQEQTDGIGQVGKALSRMENVTQGTAASAEESAAAAEQLNAQSEALNEIVTHLNEIIGGSAATGTRRVNIQLDSEKKNTGAINRLMRFGRTAA